MKLFTATKSKAYVDSSAFIAFLDSADSYHSLFSRLFSAPPDLITTSLVIAETHGWFLKRYDSNIALRFLNFCQDFSKLNIENFNGSNLWESIPLIQKFSDQDLTLVDATGLIVMKKQKIKTCWSTDRHLSLTGVPLVIHQY